MGARRRPARGRVPRPHGARIPLTAAGGPATEITLIWDGGCRLCRRAIAWVRARDRRGAIGDVPCGSAEQRARFPAIDRATCLRSVLAVRADGTVLHAERAVAEALLLLPGWRWAGVLLLVPGLRLLAAAGYRLVAALRRIL